MAWWKLSQRRKTNQKTPPCFYKSQSQIRLAFLLLNKRKGKKSMFLDQNLPWFLKTAQKRPLKTYN